MSGQWKRFSWAILSVFVLMAGCAPTTVSTGSLNEDQYFMLKNLSGETIILRDVMSKNKAVLINFWATWCPPCREEIPDLIRLQEKYPPGSLTILGVDVGESADKVSSFAKEAGINYPLLLDSDSKVAGKYRIVGIPTTLLVTPDGKILGTYHAVTPQLKAELEKIMK